ncbi:MAG: chorismate synthase [Deltaproteobacteria bacterium]|jgi:chorismate synthase|nr:chorismate synthase [Deltaproteobacteria bacterium]
MGSNSFGKIFTFSTWGESHGKAIGVVVDGCPAGLPLDESLLQRDLDRRAPGSSPQVTPRAEKDKASICSGVFGGVTTGSPISIIIENTDADSAAYEGLAGLLRPGHANYTYLEKYGIFDHRGGGRASARETVGRVAAGAVARQLLAGSGVSAGAFLSAVGGCSFSDLPWDEALPFAARSRIFAPSAGAEAAFLRILEEARREGDSVGGLVSFVLGGVPSGLGDPVYAKLGAMLGSAILSIPACKGFELGEGFAVASLRGSACNDGFECSDGKIRPSGNRAGGILGGISTGLPIYGRAAFKPTSSISRPQRTLDLQGREAEFNLPPGSRHDVCVAVRAVPVVEAMCLIVLADAWLRNRSARLEGE